MYLNADYEDLEVETAEDFQLLELEKSHACVRFVTYVIIGTEVAVYRKLKTLDERWQYLAENTFLGMTLRDR